jgi:hypothetical protein
MTKTWVTASLTLFVVALVLLALIMRDQHKAIVAVEGSLAAAGEAPAVAAAQAGSPVSPGAEPTAADVEPAPAETQTATATATPTAARVHAGTVERGRIASLAGVVSIIWLVILVLMVWRP